MSSFKASALSPRLANAIKRSACAAGLSLVASAFSMQAFAGCQYIVDNQWNNGFTAKIRITNDGTSPINGWTVSWQYTGDNRMTSNYNANFSGSNPHTASNLSWNANIQPNQSVEFGIQGTKGAGAAEVPVVTGSVCGGSTTPPPASSSVRSSSSVPASSSSAPVVVPPSSSSIAASSSSAPTNTALPTSWSLNTDSSYLNFATTKNVHNLEVHGFTTLSGEMTQTSAHVIIDLASVVTGVDIRDQRMRDLLFKTSVNPTAVATVNITPSLIQNATGAGTDTQISATLALNGVSRTVSANVSVLRTANNRVVVRSLAPILIKADDYYLHTGVEALRDAASLNSINHSVPVDFVLVFDAQ